MLGLNVLNKYMIRYGPRMATLFCLLVGFFSGCEEKTITKKSIVPVKAFKVGDMTAFTGRSFPGRAAATEEVNLGFEVSGSMVERPVDKGDEVRKGQLLARLDPRDFQNELKAAQAERDRARDYRDRIAEALESRAVAEQDLTDAQARLEQAIANVNIKRKAVNDTNIFAQCFSNFARAENATGIGIKQNF